MRRREWTSPVESTLALLQYRGSTAVVQLSTLRHSQAGVVSWCLMSVDYVGSDRTDTRRNLVRSHMLGQFGMGGKIFPSYTGGRSQNRNQ